MTVIFICVSHKLSHFNRLAKRIRSIAAVAEGATAISEKKKKTNKYTRNKEWFFNKTVQVRSDKISIIQFHGLWKMYSIGVSISLSMILSAKIKFEANVNSKLLPAKQLNNSINWTLVVQMNAIQQNLQEIK